MEEHHNARKPSTKSNGKGVWYVVAIVLLLIFVFGLASHKKKQDQSMNNNAPIVSAPSGVPARPNTGSFAFASAGGGESQPTASISVGSSQPISITMNTEGKSVLAYTLVIQYDPAQVTIGKITSAVPAFTASQIEATPGYLVVDGVKSSPDNKPVTFGNSPILNVPVTAKLAGSNNIRLVERHNKDEAKFFDENMAPYYPIGGVMTIQSN